MHMWALPRRQRHGVPKGAVILQLAREVLLDDTAPLPAVSEECSQRNLYVQNKENYTILQSKSAFFQ